MIKSKYILDILDLTFDGHIAEKLLRNQINHLTVSNTKYTTSGLFVSFIADQQIEEYIVDNSLLICDANNKPVEVLTGVEIRIKSANILADAMVYLKDGIIDYLEIHNKNGEKYLTEEPEHYELNQNWKTTNDKRSIRK